MLLEIANFVMTSRLWRSIIIYNLVVCLPSLEGSENCGNISLFEVSNKM